MRSSAIETVGYEAERQYLEVRWTGQRRVYRYHRVPAEVYQALLAAESKGAYVNEQITPRYFYEVVMKQKDHRITI